MFEFDGLLGMMFPKLFFGFGGGGGGKKSEPAQEKPQYSASQYDSPASESIYNFYSPRIKGEKTGYSESDLSTMNAQAEDSATRNANELERRGAAGRRSGYGGSTTGGTNVLREKAMQSGLEYRSNAMRDIAINNAVLKHNDQWNAATGMQNFLNSERSNALAKWTGDISLYNTQALTDVYAGSQAAQNNNAVTGQVGSLAGSLLQSYLSKNLFKTNSGPIAK